MEPDKQQSTPTAVDHQAETRLNATPTVSVAIPALNEARNIENVVRGFLASRYGQVVEILVVDGGSTDDTRALVTAMTKSDARVRLLDNPFRYQSYGLNIALSVSKGEVFLRADAHCVYGEDYVEKCINALITSGAVNVGGAQRFAARTVVQAGIALSIRSPLGSGGAKYRNPDYEGFADTVFLGCFWRTALMNVGGYETSAITNEDYALNLRLRARVFSEINITNQDAELNRRLRRQQDMAIYISNAIRVWYFPRSSLASLARQYFRYGRGRMLTSLRHRSVFARGNLPATVLLTGMLWLVLIGVGASLRDELILVSIGLGGVAAESVRVAWRHRSDLRNEIWMGESSPPGLSQLLPVVWAVLIIMPFAHAGGFFFQLCRVLLKRRVAW